MGRKIAELAMYVLCSVIEGGERDEKVEVDRMTRILFVVSPKCT